MMKFLHKINEGKLPVESDSTKGRALEGVEVFL